MGASLLALAKSMYYLKLKSFDLVNKMRFILWVVALLEACDVPTMFTILAAILDWRPVTLDFWDFINSLSGIN